MACFGVDELCSEFRKQDDEYNIIMVKALGDRLAEVRGFIMCFLADFLAICWICLTGCCFKF